MISTFTATPPETEATQESLAPSAPGYGKLRQGSNQFAKLLTGKLNNILPQRNPVTEAKYTSLRREALLAVLNGILGDYLANTGSPLAIPTRFTCKGRPLTVRTPELAAVISHPKRKLFLLVHGLCMNDLQWIRPAAGAAKGDGAGIERDTDFYSCLATDLGYTQIALHYNSGRHISTNGREFADLLEELVIQWPTPVEELVIVANSMGGLVTRSACYYGALDRRQWLRRLRKIVFLGVPHHGAPLERGGNWVDSTLSARFFTKPLARVGRIRSAGITDLRYGNLVDEDWQGIDRFERTGDRRKAVPLPFGVACYAIAATHRKNQGSLADGLIGDGLVPVDSALGRHPEPHLNLCIPVSQQQIAVGVTHLKILDQPCINEQIRRWLTPTLAI